ncbi:hypothetical protein ACER0C_003139 [Sarotherodon galilaeus]
MFYRSKMEKALPLQLLEMLKKLGEEELKLFHFYLQYEPGDDFPKIYKCQLENANRLETLEVMPQCVLECLYSPGSNENAGQRESSSLPGIDPNLHFIRHHLDEASTNSGLFDKDDGSMGSGKREAGELERYLSCPFTGGVDLLHGFPHIKKLSIKVNTALPAPGACEGLLSHAGLLFTAKQLQLHSRNLESKLLLKLNHHLTE